MTQREMWSVFQISSLLHLYLDLEAQCVTYYTGIYWHKMEWKIHVVT